MDILGTSLPNIIAPIRLNSYTRVKTTNLASEKLYIVSMCEQVRRLPEKAWYWDR